MLICSYVRYENEPRLRFPLRENDYVPASLASPAVAPAAAAYRVPFLFLLSGREANFFK